VDNVVLVQDLDRSHKLQHQALDLSKRKELALVNHLINQVGEVDAAVLKDEEDAVGFVTHDHLLKLHNVLVQVSRLVFSRPLF